MSAKLPAPLRCLLDRIVEAGVGMHVIGSVDVQRARALEIRGLVTLRDDGPFGSGNSNDDGERWYVEVKS